MNDVTEQLVGSLNELLAFALVPAIRAGIGNAARRSLCSGAPPFQQRAGRYLQAGQLVNTFRNDYVAHQNKELADAELARTALKEWANGLVVIWKMHN